MGITTKLGDNGTTDIKNKRVNKNSPIIETIGIIDELQAQLIFSYSLHQDERIKHIVDQLIELAAFLTGYRPDFSSKYVEEFENEISQKNESFSFIYPFDDQYKASLNIARTIARKLERQYLKNCENEINETIEKYLNRLSDYIYIFL